MEQEQVETILGLETALKILGGKWKILILWQLKDHPRRYNQLRREIEGITEKMLIQHLRELEGDGMIARTVFEQVPPKVEYSITEYGRSLSPVLIQLCKWGEQQDTHLPS